MKKVLLDTNGYSLLLNGNKDIWEELESSDYVYLSVFVIGELLAGFKNGNKETENKNVLNEFIDSPSVQIITATKETAEFFAHIKNQLKTKGTPIPINDVWIAAHTFESGSTLITFDRRFKKIPGIKLWDNLS